MDHIRALLHTYGYTPEQIVVITAIDTWDHAVCHLDTHTAFVIPPIFAFHPGHTYRHIRERLVTHHDLCGIIYVPGGTIAECPDSVYIVIAKPHKTRTDDPVPIVRSSDTTSIQVSAHDLQYWGYNFSFYCYFHRTHAHRPSY